ncbi:MAG: hypothetical protein PWR07_170, partial [Bacillota bacterium]|nr:hypothetical protein [Bacillota bacterium]
VLAPLPVVAGLPVLHSGTAPQAGRASPKSGPSSQWPDFDTPRAITGNPSQKSGAFLHPHLVVMAVYTARRLRNMALLLELLRERAGEVDHIAGVEGDENFLPVTWVLRSCVACANVHVHYDGAHDTLPEPLDVVNQIAGHTHPSLIDLASSVRHPPASGFTLAPCSAIPATILFAGLVGDDADPVEDLDFLASGHLNLERGRVRVELLV